MQELSVINPVAILETLPPPCYSLLMLQPERLLRWNAIYDHCYNSIAVTLNDSR